MSRPLRFHAPISNRALLLRPRLLAKLQARFDYRMIAVVAAAGFGKTTLLAQAVAENALAPQGTDRWFTCQEDDSALSFLSAGLFAAVGVTAAPARDPRAAARAVAEAIWTAAPEHIALIIDDFHLIRADADSRRLLTELVAELPRNGHVVLACRPPAPLLSHRLMAGGDALIIEEDDLQFRGAEITEFADLRGVPAELLGTVGRWPALAELTATAGRKAVAGYVGEELLGAGSSERRQALELLLTVGGGDDEIASAVLGRRVSLEEMLDGVPLVVRSASGWWSPHGLWHTVLPHRIDDERADSARRTAAAVLRGRRQYHEAMALLLDARAWDDVRRLIVEVCEVFTPLVPVDVLAGWARRLPPGVQQTPEGRLLAAMVIEPANPERAEELLRGAIAAAEDPLVRFACINALLLIAFWRGDRSQMLALTEWLDALAATGYSEAPALATLVRSLLTADPAVARAQIVSAGLIANAPLSPVSNWLLAHIVLLKLGDPAGAEPLARRTLALAPPSLRPVARSQLLESLRLLGRTQEAEDLLPELLADIDTSTVLCSPELVTTAVAMLTLVNRDEQAAQLIQSLAPTLRASPVAWAPLARVLAEAHHAVALGDEDRAVLGLREIIDHRLIRSRVVLQISPAALPLLYVLLPEIRDRWDAAPLPGCFAETHRVVQALVDVRENGSLARVRSLPLTTRRIARNQLPASWATELAVALIASGRADGRELLDDLGARARAALRDLTKPGVGAIATTARTLLRNIPAVPADRLRLRVLGPMRLERDGRPVIAPELGRMRVRHLLGHLLVHRRATRAAIMAELWPDLDEPGAGRNLRVTLAYLQNLLEPDRGDLEPPYFVRSNGAALELVTDPALWVDAHEFDRLVDAAAAVERQGAPSAALATYRQAVGLWGGDFLVDVPEGDSLRLERDRLRARFVTTAVRAGNLLLARGDVDDALLVGERALGADEWSEAAYQLLIAAHLATGDLATAARLLRRCRQMLRELGIGPHPRTRALGRQIQAQRPDDSRAAAIREG